MHRVRLESVEEGMVLSRDVENHSGYRVLGRGGVLDEAQIRLLAKWGVIDVWVEEKPAQEAAVETPGEADPLEAARERLRLRFEGRKNNDMMESLHREAEKRLDTKRFWEK